jgi:hypothetical protein
VASSVTGLTIIVVSATIGFILANEAVGVGTRIGVVHFVSIDVSLRGS